MRLENEFLVAASLQDTWDVLLDFERVASCLPGATLKSGGDDGTYRGTIKIGVGAVSMEYEGVARLDEVDEDAHRARIDVRARESRGQGSASATVENSLMEVDGGTKVSVVTEVNVSGRAAQFGRGLMQDVTGRMLKQFAKQLEREILRGSGDRAAPPPSEAGAVAAVGLSDRQAPAPSPARPRDLSLPRVAAVAGRPAAALALIAGVAVAIRVTARHRSRRRIRFDIQL